MHHSIPDQEWTAERARNGETTARAGPHLLHSAFNPTREALRAVRTIPPHTSVVVLGGYALGYTAEAIIQQHGSELSLIIADADPRAPEKAANVRGTELCSGLSGLSGSSDHAGSSDKTSPPEQTENPRVTFFSSPNPGDIASLLQSGPTGARIHYMEWQASKNLCPSWYQELGQIIADTAHKKTINAQTLNRFGPLWVRNLCANSPILARALSLTPLEQALEGIPALVLAGGPTLDRVIPWLDQLHQSHLIIAVDTALPAFADSSLAPDIIAAVDPQYWNSRHLDRADHPHALILAEPATHPAVFRRLPGLPLLMRTRFPLGTLLENAAGLQGELRAGGSVATAAWDLARHLGCSPRTIAGLDLGFPGKLTHYKNSLSQRLYHYSSTRTRPAETPARQQLLGTSPRETFDGTFIPGNPALDLYAHWFREHSEGHSTILGTQGRRIPGLTPTDISALLNKPPVRPRINALLQTIKKTPIQPQNSQRIKQALQSAHSSLKQLHQLATEGLQAASHTQHLLERGQPIDTELNHLQNIDTQIMQSRGRDLVSFLIQPTILELSTRAGTEQDPISSTRRLYTEIQQSAGYHIQTLKKYIK